MLLFLPVKSKSVRGAVFCHFSQISTDFFSSIKYRSPVPLLARIPTFLKYHIIQNQPRGDQRPFQDSLRLNFAIEQGPTLIEKPPRLRSKITTSLNRKKISILRDAKNYLSCDFGFSIVLGFWIYLNDVENFHNLPKWQVYLLYICHFGKDDFAPFWSIFLNVTIYQRETFGKKKPFTNVANCQTLRIKNIMLDSLPHW